ncbi:glycoside hydrolase 43 family protein [Micromonospora sp. DH14]|uniref:glycoside hydrolase family 43 protein n=1 Tax=Micromonospora sp. DH14 TaxID=3040120 RepID=UPI002441E144|nr:glycoside hydrolase 43 family protein [Micromonospora sp. DH14]MDG9677189.1 glycoside hydrolase 43 family protein [Micromonospora sp. DH14]
MNRLNALARRAGHALTPLVSTVLPRRLRPLCALASAAILVAASLVVTPAAAHDADGWSPRSSYTSTDTGAGTYSVPLLNADVPDISVERVPAAENDEGRDLYYMISTTMHLSPGAPIMKSYDLVNWEIVNYVFDRASIGDSFSLRNGQNSYGQGQWASSLRYHDGTFYAVFNTNNLSGAYLYRTDDIENGPWQRTALGRGLHDPSLFFDVDGTPYIFYGSGGTSAVRLNAGLTAIAQDYPNIFTANNYAGQPFIGGLFEGAQVYHIDGWYYAVIITWPSGQGRQVVMFRSRDLLGRYTSAGGVNTYEARGVLNSNGFAQGSLVPISRADGRTDWHGMFFRDTFPIGRIPALIPATWQDGWPTFGAGGVVPVNGLFDKPIRLSPAEETFERQKSIVASDDFANDAPHRAYQDEQWTVPAPLDPAEIAPNGSRLDLAWEWNHAPDNRYWSLTDRDGWLRLTAGTVVTGQYVYTKLSNRAELAWFEEARNTLSQRTFGPRQSVQTRMDISAMKNGDVAGLAAYNRGFSYVAVKRVDGVNTLGVVNRSQPFAVDLDQSTLENFVAGTTVPLGDATDVHVKADLDFASPVGQLWTTFYYSLDGVQWTRLGNRVGPQALDGSLAHFMGHRVGLFTYATQEAGGHVDFDNYLLSDVLTAQARPLDTAALDAAIAHARTLDARHYPADAWATTQAALATASAARAGHLGTQNEIDAPERALSYQLARLAVLAALPATATAQVRCLGGKTYVAVQARNDSTEPVEITVQTPYGNRSFAAVAPGASVYQSFNTRTASVPAGSATVRVTGTVAGQDVSTGHSTPHPANACGG